MRAVWKGTLTVGAVGIPVTLHKAAEHHDVEFRSVHRPCGTPIQQLRRCPTCNVELASGYADTARAVEISPGQFVVVENDELEKALGGKELALDRFYAAETLDAELVASTYWVAPAEDVLSRKAYAALLDALRESHLVGVGRLAMYAKERVAAVRVGGDLVGDPIVVLHTLYTLDELRPTTAIGDAAAAARRELADTDVVQLFSAALASRVPLRPFWKRLGTLYPSRVRLLIEAKASGDGPVFTPNPAATQAPLDLVEALRQSIPKPRTTKQRPRTRARPRSRT